MFESFVLLTAVQRLPASSRYLLSTALASGIRAVAEPVELVAPLRVKQLGARRENLASFARDNQTARPSPPVTVDGQVASKRRGEQSTSFPAAVDSRFLLARSPPARAAARRSNRQKLSAYVYVYGREVRARENRIRVYDRNGEALARHVYSTPPVTAANQLTLTAAYAHELRVASYRTVESPTFASALPFVAIARRRIAPAIYRDLSRFIARTRSTSRTKSLPTMSTKGIVQQIIYKDQCVSDDM